MIARRPVRLLSVTLHVNGIRHVVEVPVHYTLLDLLRRSLGLVGTKESCREGGCGACTVLLDDRPVASCLVLAASADGRSVMTIEGVGTVERFHPLQEAFVETGAIQCGYCTPGMILSALALLRDNPNPDEVQIRRALSGHLCRCTGYASIVDAVRRAAGCLAAACQGGDRP